MGDEFAKQGSGLVQQLAIGAAGVATAALTDDNMAGLTASTAVFGAVEYFKAKATASTGAIAQAEYAALFEEFGKLDERVSKLEQQDRRDVLSRQATYSRFARDVSEAATVGKREALVNATAHQFDPRRGSPAAREHWLSRVRDLADIEVAAILLIAQHTEITFHDAVLYGVSRGRPRPLALPLIDVVAYETVVRRLGNAGLGALVYSPGFVALVVEGRSVNQPNRVLTADGAILASFCQSD